MIFQNSCVDNSIYLKYAPCCQCPAIATVMPHYRDFRSGDVRHSQANIDKIQQYLGYMPTHRVAEGLNEATEYYVENFNVKK